LRFRNAGFDASPARAAMGFRLECGEHHQLEVAMTWWRFCWKSVGNLLLDFEANNSVTVMSTRT
jgi:hypothetical protein